MAIHTYARHLANLVADPAGQWKEVHDETPGEKFRLEITPSGLCIYEENNDRARLLTKAVGNRHNGMTMLSAHMSPDWVMKRLNP